MNNQNNSLKKEFHFSDFIAEHIIKLVSFLSFIVILLIFLFVFREALPIFSYSESNAVYNEEEFDQETYGEEFLENKPVPKESEENKQVSKKSEYKSIWENLLGTRWEPISTEPKFGILPLIVGSFKVTLIAILIAAPLGILAALYTSFFAPKWLKEILKPSIELLAGFPSVVIGFFALVFVASFFQRIFGFEYRLNAFVGGIVLSLAVIPIIFSVTEDALSAIPKSFVEASLALGAEKWQTAIFVVLPAATPGIFAAVLLGIGRAFGETMIVLMATGNAALLSFSFFEPVRTMSATIGAEMAEVVFGELHYNILFFLGSILFIFTFILNSIAEFVVRDKLMKKFGGTK